jgi:hypothetical protein
VRRTGLVRIRVLCCVLEYSRTLQLARRNGGEASELVIFSINIVAIDENAGPTTLKRFIRRSSARN